MLLGIIENPEDAPRNQQQGREPHPKLRVSAADSAKTPAPTAPGFFYSGGQLDVRLDQICLELTRLRLLLC